MKPTRHISKQSGSGKGADLPDLLTRTNATHRGGFTPSYTGQQLTVNSASSVTCINIERILLPLGAIDVTVDLNTRRLFVPTEYRNASAELKALFDESWFVAPDGKGNLISAPISVAQAVIDLLHEELCIKKDISGESFRKQILDIRGCLRLDAKGRWQLSSRQFTSIGLDKAPTNENGNPELVLSPFKFWIDFIRKDIFDHQNQFAENELSEKLGEKPFPNPSISSQSVKVRSLENHSHIPDTGGVNNTKGDGKNKRKEITK